VIEPGKANFQYKSGRNEYNEKRLRNVPRSPAP
jgi:hypothetical protein